jgi:NADH:ubiquinone oxidoreductase subunit E
MSDVNQIIDKQMKKYGQCREALMPILQDIVEEKNYVTDQEMVEVAKALDLSAADVYGTASFYSFLDTEKRGKYTIRVCKSIIAVMKGKEAIVKALENQLNIKVGQTTDDGHFSLLETNDIGQSDHEPSMLVNDEVYTDLTPAKAIEIIEEYQNK